MKKKIAFLIFVLLFLFVGFLVYTGQQKRQVESRCYSGTLEATQANLAFQVGGTISAVYVDEGDVIEKDALLAQLDQAPYAAKREEARAVLAQAQKNRERMDILLDVYEDTLPADVKRAEAAVRSSLALAYETQKDMERYKNLRKNDVVSQKNLETANLKYETAQAQLSEAKAVLSQAQSNLKKIELAQREIEVADAQIRTARAAEAFADIQKGYARLKAPFAGVVAARSVEPGEVATIGQEVLTLADLSRVELKIFVGEKEIGRVKYGDKAHVKIDAFPDRTYSGTVSFISPEAEFTPKIIQTHKERVKLVYMVKLLMPNPDRSLKPGMPADACF